MYPRPVLISCALSVAIGRSVTKASDHRCLTRDLLEGPAELHEGPTLPTVRLDCLNRLSADHLVSPIQYLNL
jgi:hypothetical protein